jgi:hypothetical protein
MSAVTLVSLADAIDALQSALVTDDDYRRTWVDNIAMAIHDTPRVAYDTQHDWRNACAERFINQLCADYVHVDIAETKP